MNPNYLDFEQPIADLEAKIQELRSASAGVASPICPVDCSGPKNH